MHEKPSNSAADGPLHPCNEDSPAGTPTAGKTRNLKPESARRDVIIRRIILSVVAVALVAAFAGLATGEAPKTGGLIVTVVGESGPLSAIVTISNEKGLVKQTAIQADGVGRARFPVLRPGSGYVIEVSLPGYRAERVEDIEIRAGESTTVTVELTPVSPETAKREPAPAPVRTAAEAEKKEWDQLAQSELVPGRTYQNVLTISPGVQDADGDGNPNVQGSRDRDFKAVVGGVANVDPLTGQQRSQVNPNSIEEIQVITAGSGAEFSRSHQGFADLRYKGSFSETFVQDLPVPNTEAYDEIVENGFRPVATAPLSTFSIDVDTASYSNVRRFLNQGRVPPPGAVRIEELINYFDYTYKQPEGNVPFGVDVEVAEAPWNPRHRLARIGLKGRELAPRQRPDCNLVFLIDVSGSMGTANKLPLVQRSMKMLVDELNGRDQVSIVVYAGAAGLVLEPTPATNRNAIFRAIDALHSGGSTAGGAGIQLAYQQARRSFIEGGVNRVMLATDGDFNVGVSDRSSLIQMIEREAKSGVFLTTLGFGMGNLKDSRLEQLANHGNGNYAYIDDLREARKVLVEEAGSTLIPIAKDVKIQVEFNPAEVASYRLIGYENRALRDEDFNDDTKDAGEIGAGHTVTALYEIVPQGLGYPRGDVDPLKYQRSTSEPEENRYEKKVLTEAAASGELLTVKIRWKDPDGTKSKLQELAVVDRGRTLAAASDDFCFAAAVAGFGMLLRGSEHAGDLTYNDVIALAENGMRADRHGHRAGFLQLVGTARVTQRVSQR